MHELRHLGEDSGHQVTVYQCLNTEEIKRLFESLHDHSRTLRVTALVFIAKLLHNCPQIVDTLLLRDNCDVMNKKSGFVNKFLISGLAHYNLSPQKMLQIVRTLNKLVYKKCLFFYINVENFHIGYFSLENLDEGKEIDPKENLIGIFSTDPERERTISGSASSSMIRRNNVGQGRYTIGKTGQFSINSRGYGHG